MGLRLMVSLTGFHCSISHFCSEQYSFQQREQRQGLVMAASTFMQMLCPDAILSLLWGTCG